MAEKGKVYFVGAGPGAIDLITVRGLSLIKEADTIIYAGSLVNPELLSFKKEGAFVYDSSKMTLDEIVERMVSSAKNNETVIRLHTGDPSLYGAIGEQMRELKKRDIPFEVCPGVSACFGAAASLSLEYTLPDVSQTLILTRLSGKTLVPKSEEIESLAAHRASMAVYLSSGMLPELTQKLIAGGYEEDTESALIYKATWPDEKVIRAPLSKIPKLAKKEGIDRFAILIVGAALSENDFSNSKLYDKNFDTAFRKGEGK